MRVVVASLAALIVAAAGPTYAQSSQPASAPRTIAGFEPILRNWTRIEAWSFFEPPPAGGDPGSTYVANRLLVGARRVRPTYEISAAFQYVQFGGLPDDAIGPGPLGLGAVYFDHAGRSDSRGVYLKALHLKLKDLAPGLTVQIGRMPFAGGSEAPSGDARIEALKRQRLEARLLGEFEWSLYQRAFDGVRVDYARGGWQGTGAVFRPTQGGFEDAAGIGLSDVTVAAGSISARPGRVLRSTDAQAFVYHYADRRQVRARPDNTGQSAARADVGITTVGASLAASWPAPSGDIDLVFWIAGQGGSWYDQDHGAIAVAIEGGHQWTSAPWRPWVRAGFNRASGDADPADGDHGTFFQMLPTARKYSLSATYSFMNLQDVFATVMARPHTRVGLRFDVHRLTLAEAADRWYFGSGATQESGTTFGFGTRPSNGSTDFAMAFDASVDVTITPRWSIAGYLGVLRGGDVVTRTFAGDVLRFAYIENVLQL